MKIKTGVISVLTSEMAKQAQGSEEAWQCVAQSKKTIEAQKEIIRNLTREIDFMKSQLTAWHLLLESGIIDMPQNINEEDNIFAGFKKNIKEDSIYNPDGSIKKNKLN